jgi:hypothetical protein
MNGYVRRFAMDWIENHVEAVPLNMRHEEASRLASKLLNFVAREGLDRDDIEEALGTDLEFYMFEAATTAIVQADAALGKTRTPPQLSPKEGGPPRRLGRHDLQKVWLN